MSSCHYATTISMSLQKSMNNIRLKYVPSPSRSTTECIRNAPTQMTMPQHPSAQVLSSMSQATQLVCCRDSCEQHRLDLHKRLTLNNRPLCRIQMRRLLQSIVRLFLYSHLIKRTLNSGCKHPCRVSIHMTNS